MLNQSSCKNSFEKIKMSFLKSVIENLPHPNPEAEDPRALRAASPSGMILNLTGFTLIELLVVVLIIGILAAIALPQYQKAVEKSKAAQALAGLNAYSRAYQTYYMSEGVGPTSLDVLDVNISWNGTEGWRRLMRTEPFLTRTGLYNYILIQVSRRAYV